MKILITNDDGIRAEGLAGLVNWAKKLGEVTVIAPAAEQSGKSHGIDLHNAMKIKRVELFDGIEAYEVHSTPADCVRFGFIGLERKFDLVFSGINFGFNMGTDIVYSGTVGAAFEAVNFGARAIAVSTSPDSLDAALKKLDTAYDFVINNRLFDAAPLYNINIPRNDKGIRITRQGKMYYSDHFVLCGEDEYRQKGYLVYEPSNDLTLDTDAVMNGYLSITPLTNDRTALAAYEAFSHLNI